jgi:hypothetical protein
LQPITKENSWASYILTLSPLITANILLYIFNLSPETKDDWSLVWTHQATPDIFVKSSLFPSITKHKTYAVLISRNKKLVVDFLSLWSTEVGGDDANESWWFVQLLAAESSGGSNVPSVPVMGMGASYYTCDDTSKMYEYLERYCEGLRETVSPPVATAEKPKDVQETKTPPSSTSTSAELKAKQALDKDAITPNSNASSPEGSGFQSEEEEEEEGDNEDISDTDVSSAPKAANLRKSAELKKPASLFASALQNVLIFALGMAAIAIYLFASGLVTFNDAKRLLRSHDNLEL